MELIGMQILCAFFGLESLDPCKLGQPNQKSSTLHAWQAAGLPGRPWAPVMAQPLRRHDQSCCGASSHLGACRPLKTDLLTKLAKLK